MKSHERTSKNKKVIKLAKYGAAVGLASFSAALAKPVVSRADTGQGGIGTAYRHKSGGIDHKTREKFKSELQHANYFTEQFYDGAPLPLMADHDLSYTLVRDGKTTSNTITVPIVYKVNGKNEYFNFVCINDNDRSNLHSWKIEAVILDGAKDIHLTTSPAVDNQGNPPLKSLTHDAPVFLQQNYAGVYYPVATFHLNNGADFTSNVGYSLSINQGSTTTG